MTGEPEGFETPEAAAAYGMSRTETHVVEVRMYPGGDTAYVLLASAVKGAGYYLDGNMVARQDGRWFLGCTGGGGWTDRTLEDLRASPPAQFVFAE